MSDIKHTPGPWRTDEDEHDAPYQDIRIKAANRTVCKVWIDDAPVHDYNAEQEANARLIAAAPQLLDALQPFVRNNSSDEFVTLVVRSSDITKARAAIAKATGKS